MDLFVYDPATNTVEERGEIVPGLGGEVRPLVTGPDGRIYGTGTRDNRAGLYIYDPKLGKVVKAFGPVGPSHPNGAWSRYVMGVDDTHAYIASRMIPRNDCDAFAISFARNSEMTIRLKPEWKRTRHEHAEPDGSRQGGNGIGAADRASVGLGLHADGLRVGRGCR